jgi:hypothetical protein
LRKEGGKSKERQSRKDEGKEQRKAVKGGKEVKKENRGRREERNKEIGSREEERKNSRETMEKGVRKERFKWGKHEGKNERQIRGKERSE